LDTHGSQSVKIGDLALKQSTIIKIEVGNLADYISVLEIKVLFLIADSGGMAECSCSQSGSGDCDIAALQQCFERLYSSPVPPISSSSTQQSTQNCRRSPLPYSLFPLQVIGMFVSSQPFFIVLISASCSVSCVKVQRRWSETAAAEMSGESVESTMRRWSMPWDCKHVIEWPRQDARSRLRVPQQDRSRSTTPDSVWKTSMASQDGLQEAIQLLSCKPGSKTSIPRDGLQHDFMKEISRKIIL